MLSLSWRGETQTHLLTPGVLTPGAGCASPCCRLFLFLLGLSIPASGKAPLCLWCQANQPLGPALASCSRATSSRGAREHTGQVG